MEWISADDISSEKNESENKKDSVRFCDKSTSVLYDDKGNILIYELDKR